MKKLNTLLNRIECKKNYINDIEINSIKHDAKEVEKGDLFICLKGNLDGHDFAEKAVNNGAKAIVCEKSLSIDIPQIIVKNTRKAYSILANNYYDNPDKDLKIMAVVGTNGKTTVSHLINHILKDNNIKTGLIGTIGNEICGEFHKATLTTPDPMEFNELLFEMKKKGAEAVVMELSAHAIYLKKLYGIVCDYGIFTNLTQDHLDFFQTMEKYKKVKSSFFKPGSVKFCILNNDDETGLEIANKCKLPYLTYGINSPSDSFAMDINYTYNGSKFLINIMDEIYEVKSKLFGEFNIYNILAAVTATRAFGISLANIVKSIEKFDFVSGRFNVYVHNGIKFIIDYAHTPDGLKNLLQAARGITDNEITLVFGCGGDRDKVKRPVMGKIAEDYADNIIITSDNPRHENPEEIIKQIKSGIIEKCAHTFIDREAAIFKAYEVAMPGDTIVIAGKGAEEYIEIENKKIPYSDLNTVKKIMEN